MSNDDHRTVEENTGILSRTDKLRADNFLIQQQIAKLERQKTFYMELFMEKIKLDLNKVTPEQQEFLNSFSEDDG